MNTSSEKYLSLAKEIILKSVPKDDYAVFLFGPEQMEKVKELRILMLGYTEKNRSLR